MMTESLRWYPVHCCCTPRIIYGFLPLPVGSLIFEVRDHNGHDHRVELKELIEPRPGLSAFQIAARTLAGKSSQEVELAVYSEDRPLEFWRSIPGFIEAQEHRR